MGFWMGFLSDPFWWMVVLDPHLNQGLIERD